MNRKRVLRIRPFRVLSIGLGLLTLFLLAQFPKKMVSIEEQQRQLTEAAGKYFDAQSINNQLHDELKTVGTHEFVERVARRDQDYCWYGEVIYEVTNLDELMTPEEYAIYGQR